MNKILKSFLIIGLGLGIFTACDDDCDSNPTLISPTEFVLNTPAISGTVIGVFIIALLQEGILALGFTKDYQLIITGLIVIVAVFSDVVARRRKN